MNKIFKVIWNEARNAYVVVSEIAKNHGSKSCSTKKLLAMLIATGVMTCASFDVLAEKPVAATTDESQYVAFKYDSTSLHAGQVKKFGDYKYIYDATNKYWVREGYVLTVDENGGKYTPLSQKDVRADVAYTKTGVPEGILQSVTSTVAHNGVVTHSGDSLQKITAGSYAGVSHGGGTVVAGSWNYIINDASWEGSGAEYQNGYVDLKCEKGEKMPKGFKTTDSGLNWDEVKQTYTYQGKAVDYRNMYVIDGKLGVFTNADGSDVYTGTVYGKNNEILMTVKDNGKFYSYWAASVTDPSATMETYPVSKYNSDMAVIDKNIKDLNKDIIKEVTLTKDTNSAIIGLVRNGGKAVDGAITVTSGGGTGGSGAAHDTFVKISNSTTEQTFATGSKVEAIVDNGATTGIKINGQAYTIKSGSKVSVTQNAAEKTTTITVDGTETTITDTDTTYTEGDGIEISDANAISVSKNLTGMQSIKGAGAGSISFDGANVKVNNTTFSKNSVVVGVAGDGKHPVRINGESGEILGLGNDTITYTTFAQTDGKAATEKQLKQVMDEGWNFTTDSGAKTTVTVGEAGNEVKFNGDSANIEVTNNGKDIKVALKNDLTVDSVKAGDFFMDKNQGVGYADKAYITSSGLNANNQKITGVADGTNDTDAVNFGQLKETNTKVENLKVEAGKHTTLVAGENVQLNQENTDKGLQYTINAKDTTYAAGNGITISGANNEISVKVKAGENNLQVTDAGLELKKDLTVDSVKAGSSFMSATGIGYGDKAYITSSGLNANNQKITGVAAGNADTDAVNVGQLKTVSEVANQGWKLSTNGDAASKVAPGEIVDFSGDKNISVSHNGTKVKVELNDELEDIKSISNGDSRINLNADSISISNGNKSFAITNSGIGMSYITADYSAKSIMLGENGTTISGGLNVAGSKITGVAAGTAATDAVNVGQLNAVKETANKGWKLKTNNGNVSDVKPGDEVEFDGDDNIKVSNASNKVSFKLNNKLTGIESIAGVGGGSISFSGGNVTINNNVTFGSNGQIHNVTAGTASTDAVNVGQLNAAVQAGNTDTHIKPGEYVVGADNKVNMDVVDKTCTKINTVTITDVAKASDLGNVNNINNDLKNSNGTTTVVDAVNNLNQKLDNKVGDLQYSKVDKGDIADGDSTTTAIGKLDQKLNDVAATAAKQHTTVSGSGNIVVEDPTTNTDGGKNYNVKLADNITVNSVTANTFKADQTVMDKYGLKVGDKVSVTATAVTAGKTSISDEGVKVGDKTYISADGLNANGQHITNVKAGEADTDAVNYGQLKDTNNRINGVENQVISNSNRINQLGSRVNKVGAGAAALAALHPMDFDPDDKLTFSAGYGNYGGENAAAIGAYYRPDEKVMFSVGGTVGNGENMVNAGVSFALDRTNHVSNSRTALAREVIDLRGQLAVMGAKMAKMEKALGMLDETKTKLFPDIPANHWAYEYIAKLAGNGYIEGYPDGNFGGDRLMTRYEFAAMLYRAIENGAALEEKIIKEFEPELGRIRVDRISGEDGDRDKIERVRVNDTKGERDHYGNKLAK